MTGEQALRGAAAPLRSSAAVMAVIALVTYVAWSYLSATWAELPAVAVRGSNRALVYLACFAIMALFPWWRRGKLAVIGGVSLVIAGVGVVTFVRLLTTGEPSAMFEGPLLASPIGYHNASAALWTIGALPLLIAATQPGLWAPLRGLLLGVTGLLLHLAILTQSRGWLFTLPVVLAVVLLLTPYRARLVLATAIVTTVTLSIVPALLGVYRVGPPTPEAVSPGALRDPVAHAVRVSAVACIVLAAIGIVWSLVEGRMTIRFARVTDRLRRMTTKLHGVAGAWRLVIPVLVVCASGAVLTGVAGDRIGDRWTGFRDYQPPVENSTGARYSSLKGGRSDIWQVSVDVVRTHPLIGLGQDNFARAYLRNRHSPYETQQWTHSVWLRLLVHTGLVGFVLFAMFLLWAGQAVSQAWRGVDPSRKAFVAAAVVPVTVWLVHGSVDRFWEDPVLSCLAFAGLGLAVSLGRGTAIAKGASARGVCDPSVAAEETVPSRATRLLS